MCGEWHGLDGVTILDDGKPEGIGRSLGYAVIVLCPSFAQGPSGHLKGSCTR